MEKSLKLTIVGLLTLMILSATGCFSNEASPTIDTLPPATEAETTETATESTFTLKNVLELAAKHDQLSLNDLVPYSKKIESLLQTGGSVQDNLFFTYDNKEYCMRINAAVDTYANSQTLSSILLFHKEFLTLEDEYSYLGGFGDIRSSNIDHILSGQVDIFDYIYIDPPDSIELSHFKFWLGSLGGVTLHKNIANSETPENLVIGRIQIEVPNGFRNQSTTIESYGTIILQDVLLTREQIHYDSGDAWYVATLYKENALVAYSLYLNAACVSASEFLEITDSFNYREHAFY